MQIKNKDYYKMIAPRPTVCVSTIDGEENSNLAPYSFATPISFSPPLFAVSVGGGKDTILNARETEDFVVTPLTKKWMEKGVRSEISLPRGDSEFEKVGLTQSSSEVVKSPSVGEAPVNIECKYWDDFEVGDHFVLVGEVVHISAKEDAVKNGRINLENLGTVGHVTGEEFCISEEIVKIERE
ncbi:hypothetical protein AKJ38_02665 [candidate division MSBL1 archaeon SCGC-AAA259I14]|uniref:Flavin reductase like domain-containing protein n=1 Tax=candidate division MSBL1 archaeon SCGC-AAA259I14 TaxID=1698268 RepID=A0A133UR93_9EURY|nr:hypothetical protein AKJ38_02665 [candidate division MSBL1 archaeon SCGC-AAA259I14]